MLMANEAQIQEKAAEIRRLLEEIAFLSKSELPTQEYFRRFLELTCRALDAPGGVIWLKTGQGFQRLCTLKFADCEYDTNEAQRQSITKVLNDVSENRRPVVVGAFDPNAATSEEGVTVMNRTPYPFFFSPVQLNNQVVVVLHIWLAPETDPKLYREFVTFLQTVSGQAEIYLRSRRLEALTAEAQKLTQLITLLGEMEGVLEPDKLSMIIANHGREVTGVDRVCVAVRRHEKTRVLAVSGVETVDKKSVTIKSIVELAERTMAADQPQLLIKGDEHAEEEEIKNYFSGGTMRAAYLLPLKDRNEKTLGVLVVETTRPDGINEPVRKLSQAVARHAGAALGAAEEERSIPLLPTLRKLKRAKDWAMGEKRRRVQLALGVPVAVLTVLALMPWPFRVKGDAQLQPAARGAAVAEVQGRIAAVFAQEGQSVKKGDVLAQFDDTELQRQLAVAQAEWVKNTVEADRHRESRDPQASAARRVAEAAAMKAAAEVGRLQHAIELARIRCPIDGVVMSRDLESKVGEVLDRGAVFAEVGDPTAWQAQIQVREGDVAPLERKLANNEPIPVTVLTRGWTGNKFKGAISHRESISQLSYPPPGGSGAPVFYVTVDLDLSPEEAALLRPGFTGRAKLQCGWRPLGFVLGRRFVDYLKVNWLL